MPGCGSHGEHRWHFSGRRARPDGACRKSAPSSPQRHHKQRVVCSLAPHTAEPVLPHTEHGVRACTSAPGGAARTGDRGGGAAEAASERRRHLKINVQGLTTWATAPRRRRRGCSTTHIHACTHAHVHTYTHAWHLEIDVQGLAVLHTSLRSASLWAPAGLCRSSICRKHTHLAPSP
jgi:hypothetical protein